MLPRVKNRISTDFFIYNFLEGEIIQPLLRLVVLWRRDMSHVRYEWVPGKWDADKNFSDTTSALEKTITRLLKPSETLPNEASVKVRSSNFIVAVEV